MLSASDFVIAATGIKEEVGRKQQLDSSFQSISSKNILKDKEKEKEVS